MSIQNDSLQAIAEAIKTVGSVMDPDVHDAAMLLLEELDTTLVAINYTQSAEEAEKTAELHVAIGELTADDKEEKEDDDDDDEDDPVAKGVTVDDDDETTGS